MVLNQLPRSDASDEIEENRVEVASEQERGICGRV